MPPIIMCRRRFYEKWMLLGCLCIVVFLFYYINKTYELAHLELPSLHSQNALLLNEQGEVLYEKMRMLLFILHP